MATSTTVSSGQPTMSEVYPVGSRVELLRSTGKWHPAIVDRYTDSQIYVRFKDDSDWEVEKAVPFDEVKDKIRQVGAAAPVACAFPPASPKVAQPLSTPAPQPPQPTPPAPTPAPAPPATAPPAAPAAKASPDPKGKTPRRESGSKKMGSMFSKLFKKKKKQ